MAKRYPNNAGQSGIYYSGGGGYLDVDATFDALNGDFRTFAEVASADGWANGDTVDVYARSSEGNWLITTGTWDEANEYLLVGVPQDVKGVLSDSDAIEVSATITKQFAENISGGEWTLASEVDKQPGDANVLLAIPSSARDVKIVLSGFTAADTIQWLIARIWLNGVQVGTTTYENCLVYSGYAGTGVDPNGFYTKTHSVFTLVAPQDTGIKDCSGELFLYNVQDTQTPTVLKSELVWRKTDDSVTFGRLSGYEPTLGNITAIEFLLDAADLSTGNFKIYTKE